MGGHSSKSSAQNSGYGVSRFSQYVPANQSKALTDLYNQAKTQFGQTNAAGQALTPAANNFINQINQGAMGGYQNQLQGGVYGGMGNADMLGQSLAQSLNNPSNAQNILGMIMGGQGNNYADAMKASYITDANRAAQNMLGNLDARAEAAGMGGSSRHGTAIANGYNDINTNLQRMMADVGYNTFDKDLQQKLAIAQQADQGTLARQGMLGELLGQQQGVQSGAVAGGQNMQNLGMGAFAPSQIPWQNMANYSNVIGSPTVLSQGTSENYNQGSSNSKGGGGGILTS